MSSQQLAKKATFLLLGSVVMSMIIFIAGFVGLKSERSPIHVSVNDQAKLQRGAKLYMNYCSGCHSLRYLRYNRMGEDLGLITKNGRLDKTLLMNNLVFTRAKIHESMQNALPQAEARRWFGVVPPDLSSIARVRGANWLYLYLKGFYADNSRPFGTNNIIAPNTSMPNILDPLVGSEMPAMKTQRDQEFDKVLEDLVSFLVYVGEPAQLVRYRLGIKVLVFLSIFLVVVCGINQFRITQ